MIMNKNIVNTNEAPQAIGVYSQAIISNGFIYTSGQICINPKTNKLNNANLKNPLIINNDWNIEKEIKLGDDSLIIATRKEECLQEL